MKTSIFQNKSGLFIAAAILISFATRAQSKLPDGTILYPDGHRQLPNGTVVYPPVYDKKAGILGSIFGGGNPRRRTMSGNIFGSIFGSRKTKSKSILNPVTGTVLGSIFGSNPKGKPKTLPDGSTVFPGNGRRKNLQVNSQNDQVINVPNANNDNGVAIQVPQSQQRHAVKRTGL